MRIACWRSNVTCCNGWWESHPLVHISTCSITIWWVYLSKHDRSICRLRWVCACAVVIMIKLECWDLLVTSWHLTCLMVQAQQRPRSLAWSLTCLISHECPSETCQQRTEMICARREARWLDPRVIISERVSLVLFLLVVSEHPRYFPKTFYNDPLLKNPQSRSTYDERTKWPWLSFFQYRALHSWVHRWDDEGLI